MEKRLLADKGYNASDKHRLKVFITGQERGITPQLKRELRRRATVEPVIGHLKSEDRMGRNILAHRAGDAILAAAGYNFPRLLVWLALLLSAIWAAFTPPKAAPLHRQIA